VADERDEFGEEIPAASEEEVTTFSNVDVEDPELLERHGPAPSGDSLERTESDDIKNQLERINQENELRAPNEKIPVAPEDVS
jgi:hypothetical protein